ncbi:MAG TPA: hypothetical protein VHK02_06460 [Actinomycetota bacterium]|jgi:hypothetical protein|nr:hypothetical protein [Actinomycetota bacterium]
MTHHDADDSVQLNRSMIVGGGVLVALGGLLGFTGMTLLVSALVSATRRYVDRMEQPPSDLARRKWQQTKAAASAGASAGAAAWRDKTPSG